MITHYQFLTTGQQPSISATGKVAVVVPYRPFDPLAAFSYEDAAAKISNRIFGRSKNRKDTHHLFFLSDGHIFESLLRDGGVFETVIIIDLPLSRHQFDLISRVCQKIIHFPPDGVRREFSHVKLFTYEDQKVCWVNRVVEFVRSAIPVIRIKEI